MADYVALLFGSQNHIHMAYLRYFFGLQLCITSGNYHKGIGVLFVYLPNQPAAFLIGQLRHRAGIDDAYIGLFPVTDPPNPVCSQLLPDRRCFRKIELAT